MDLLALQPSLPLAKEKSIDLTNSPCSAGRVMGGMENWKVLEKEVGRIKLEWAQEHCRRKEIRKLGRERGEPTELDCGEVSAG